MTFSPANSQSATIPENITFSKDPNQFYLQLTTVYNQIARSINLKDIASYETVEIITGQQFFGADNQTKRRTYRKCFSFGAIAAGANIVFAHGITQISMFTRIIGTCVTNIPDYRPIPYASVTNLNQQIEINIGVANITISNGAGGPNITSGICVVEFLKI